MCVGGGGTLNIYNHMGVASTSATAATAAVQRGITDRCGTTIEQREQIAVNNNFAL